MRNTVPSHTLCAASIAATNPKMSYLPWFVESNRPFARQFAQIRRAALAIIHHMTASFVYTQDGRLPLHIAAMQEEELGSLAKVKSLLRKHPEGVKTRDKVRSSAWRPSRALFFRSTFVRSSAPLAHTCLQHCLAPSLLCRRTVTCPLIWP